MNNKNIQILNVQAKDIITGKCAIVDQLGKKTIDELRKQRYRILSNYRGSLDYSLLTIYLQENYKNFIKLNNELNRFYSNNIITVKFDYNYDITNDDIEYLLDADERYNNRIVLSNMFRFEREKLSKLKTSIDGKVYRLHMKEILDDEEMEKLHNLEEQIPVINNKLTYIRKLVEYIDNEIKYIKDKYNFTTNKLREQLYKDGFTLNVNNKNIHYVRFFRSSGSARNGKVNFINERYYNKVIHWLMCGIDYKNTDKLDLPSLEAYISLVSSSIIDTFELKPQNILLIDDAESTFKDTVMATELVNTKQNDNKEIVSGELYTHVAEKKISNKLFDGEALLDKSIFVENGYSNKAILQLRNRFYKGIGINTDIQQFFTDNDITDISQLHGQTLATDIKDIKLITTKSSIKYLKYFKYHAFKEWTKIMNDTWGICKYDKGQEHNFNGMVNTHYQLLNTLGLNRNDMLELLEPTLNYIKLLKNDISVFKLHLGLMKDADYEFDYNMDNNDFEKLDNIRNNSDFILKMLQINENFIKTQIARKFKYETIENYIQNVKRGHILIDGTYATVIDCPYEYLLCAIGKWDEKSSIIGTRECYTAKFKVGQEILGVRSPQPTMSNMTVFRNIDPGIMSKYFNTESDNVIYISAIGWNVMELESSMDFDGDAMLITNNKIITDHCKRLNETVNVNYKKIKRFLVSTDFTLKTKINRTYIPKNLCDTDIKCSQGKIGECINLVQMLNSLYWDKKSKGVSEEELFELYKDISNLNVLSCIIIDSAKKDSPVDVKKEMNKIREKNYLGKGNIVRDKKKKIVNIRPYFFKYLDGGKDYKFKKFNTGMDYLIDIMNSKEIKIRKNRDNENGNVTLKSLLYRNKNRNKADRKKINDTIELILKMQIEISKVYKSKDETKDKFRMAEEIRDKYYAEIRKKEWTTYMIYTVLKRVDEAFEDRNSRFQKYKKFGRNILKTLYLIDKSKFLNCFKIIPNVTETLIKNENGEINIYRVKYRKLKKR